MDARCADGGIGVGSSAIGCRGKGLALAILLITGDTKTARKSEVISPALFAFFPHAASLTLGITQRLAVDPQGKDADGIAKLSPQG